MDPQQQVFNQMIYMLIQQGKPYVEAMNEASDIISGFIPFKSSFDEAKR